VGKAMLLGWQPVRGGETGLAVQIEDEFARRITDGVWRAGTRLPSLRHMAQHGGISRFTVIEAYERLSARGLVEAQHGAGYFVRGGARGVPPVAEPASAAVPDQLDISWLVQRMLDSAKPSDLPTALGLLPHTWLDPDLVARAVRKVSRTAGDVLLHYGHPQGVAGLRQALEVALAAQGVTADAQTNLVTTAGVTHGIDLVLRLLVRPGDTVLVEDPGWFLIFGRLAAYGVRIVGVPRGPDGPDIAALDAMAALHTPRLFLINSAVHNPTGSTLGIGAAYDVLKLAEKHDFMILEDDTYADFHPGQPIRLAALDRLNRVILLGGYAKVLAAGLRVGYLAARPDLVARLVELKLLNGLTTPGLGELVVQQMLTDGHYSRHVGRVRARVDAARTECVQQLGRLGLYAPTPPIAGMFVWVDCGLDSEKVTRIAASMGLVLAPGTLFSPTQAPSRMLRFTVSAIDHPRLWPMLEDVLQRARH